ncbi:hypothetical protein KAU11_02690 [Candidatus Babeliales bacterium]|nr:hypothetical protein [Candidatus Babeliales bacterium]
MNIKFCKVILLILACSTAFPNIGAQHKMCTAVYSGAAALGVAMVVRTNYKSYIDFCHARNEKLNKQKITVQKPDVQKLVQEFIANYTTEQRKIALELEKQNAGTKQIASQIQEQPKKVQSQTEKGLIKNVIGFVKHSWKSYKEKDLAPVKPQQTTVVVQKTVEIKPPSAEAIAAYVQKHEEAYLRQCAEAERQNKELYKQPSFKEFCSHIPEYSKRGNTFLRLTGGLLTFAGTAAAATAACLTFVEGAEDSKIGKMFEKYCPCCKVREELFAKKFSENEITLPSSEQEGDPTDSYNDDDDY